MSEFMRILTIERPLVSAFIRKQQTGHRAPGLHSGAFGGGGGERIMNQLIQRIRSCSEGQVGWSLPYILAKRMIIDGVLEFMVTRFFHLSLKNNFSLGSV